MQYVDELAELLGSMDEAQSILSKWLPMASIYRGAPLDTFTGEDSESNSQRLTRLKTALAHVEGLIPLLDDRLAWVTACYMPGMSDGPEVAEDNEQRIDALKTSLCALREDLARAVKKSPPVVRGRTLELTPRLMLTIDLISRLKQAGIPMSTGERAKMVRAMRVCWEAANIDGDPRDLLRSLEKRRAQIGASS